MKMWEKEVGRAFQVVSHRGVPFVLFLRRL